MINKFVGAGAVAAVAILLSPPANALTSKECSAKYRDAQQSGTLKDQKWNDFRKTQCSGPSASAATPAATTGIAPTASSAARAAPAAPAARADTSAPKGGAVFPTTVSAKYGSESAGKARMHTCLDQYNANKSGNGNGGLKWIEKGGGYYSQCNSRLKG